MVRAEVWLREQCSFGHWLFPLKSVELQRETSSALLDLCLGPRKPCSPSAQQVPGNKRRPLAQKVALPVGQVNLGLLQWACLGQWRSCLTRTGCVQIPWDRLGVCGSFGPEPHLLWDVLLRTAKEGGESLILPSSLLLSPHCPCSRLETLSLLLRGDHSLIRFPKIQWVPSHQHSSCLL